VSDVRAASVGLETTGRVVSVNVSVEKGTRKSPVPEIVLVTGLGVEGDAHAGAWHRQVSLLSSSSIEKMRAALPGLGPGDFAENLTVAGLEVSSLPVGSVVAVGAEARLEITQIGKECHLGCEIRRQVGDCVMPREGVFARVVSGGAVRAGDQVTVLEVRP
jgi:MOSC domain-containing protein YiiM